MVKKGFMAGLLVLCTSFAFAADVATTADKNRPTSVPPSVDQKPIQQDASASATDAVKNRTDVKVSANNNSHRSGATMTANNVGKLSPTANHGGASNWFGLRAGVCDDAIYSTGDADGNNGLTSERGNFGIESFCADDAAVDSDTTIGALHWQGLVSVDYGDSTVDVLILPDDGGVPNGDDGSALLNVSDAGACRVDTGNSFFGYPVIQYSYYPNGGLAIPAGTTWFAARPVSGSGGGRSFWATANFGSPQGYAGQWRSSYFGYPDWSNASSQLGADTDFAMCITGAFGGGSCCVAGDCSETTKEECDSLGGTFNEGVPCCGTVCPGRAAGCCFEDGTCENLKPADCEEQGGIYQGEENLCRGGLCPLPDFCADALYSQFGYDGINGLSAQDSGDIGYVDSEVADDAVFTGAVEVTGAVWQTIDRGNPSVTVGDYDIYYTSPSGGPGKLVSSGDDVSLDARLTDGSSIFGGTVWVYKLTTSTTRAVSGGYYFSLRPRIEEFVQSFWLTAPGGNGEAYFRSAFFGYSNWVPANSVFGAAYDVSFCVLGQNASEGFGACCLDGESRCELLTSAECSNAGGTYYGDDSPCFPSPCANEPGACCNPDDGSCQITKPAECDELGYGFIGGGTECAPGVCPLPDFCADSIYTQFGYDGSDGYANQDTSSLNWVEAWTTDDAAAPRAEVSGVVVQNITRGNPAVDEVDGFLAYTNPSGGPGKMIINLDNSTDFIRLTDGSGLFGGTVWVTKLNFPATRVVPGDYYTSAREVINEYVQSFLLTTGGGGGNEAYFRGAIFGFSNWVPISQVAGIPYEFSFCLLGTQSSDEFGACCANDETTCTLSTQAECDALGGRYVGTDAPCFPSPCENAPGACCFLDPYGCEDGASQKSCEDRGGTFQGGDTECANVRCPLPDFCADAIYSQFGYDGVNGYSNQDTSSLNWIDAYVSDDADFGTYVEITRIVIQSIDRGNPTVSEVDWSIWSPASGGGPGKVIGSGDNVTTFVRATDGSSLFGGTVWTLSTDVDPTKVVPGQYWFNTRPVINEYVQSFWLTAPGNGNSGYFKGALFGIPNWISFEDYVGFPYEFSMCIVGSETAPFGACCIDDDSVCVASNESECDGLGGSYYGDGTPCSPSPCPNAVGACCFLEPFGCEDGTKRDDCESRGGTFQGGDVLCTEVKCPLPDFCENSYYSQFGYNSQTIYFNADASIFGFEYWTADDFTAADPIEVTAVATQTADYSFGGDLNGIAEFQYAIWASTATGPGKELVLGTSTSFERGTDGSLMFGFYPIYQNRVTFNDAVRLVPGDYYISARPVINGNFYSYLASNTGGGQPGYNRYQGQTWNNTGLDFGFCVIASKSNEAFGACCTENETVCSIATKTECDAAGGRYAGDNATCFPNPCENAPGACCFESGECSFGTPGDCADNGGNFQGGDVECTPGLCPIPDPCDGEHGEVWYNNSKMDGINALMSFDGRNSTGYDTYCANDATFDGNVTIGGMHYYTWDTPGLTSDGGDYIIIEDNGGSPLGGTELENVEDVTMVRLGTGEKIFGYYDVYQNNFTGLNTPLSAGTYWFALRINVTNSNYSYWGTAPLVDNPCWFRSPTFGYTDWVEGNTQFGYDTDQAMCLTAPADPCFGVVKGDADGDGSVTFNDIDCFVAALISFDDWEDCGTLLSGDAAFLCANDIDGDLAVTFNDIDGFIDCLINEGCP